LKKIFIAAGGTGGHINAALSMGEVFQKTYEVKYITGERYLDYQLFKDKKSIHIKARPLRSNNPLLIVKNLIINCYVFLSLLTLFLKTKPEFVIGAGGYVCGPSLLGAKLLGTPIFIIEQNAVMGLTNRILSKISNLIFTNFKETKGLVNIPKVITVGNPINSKIKYTENIEEEYLKVLVFGGSLGATQINEMILEVLNKKINKKIYIRHQVGKNNLKNINVVNENIKYEEFEYFNDMDLQYEWSNLIIARAGASTISELRVVKRPCVLIPYPAATDNHQYYNAIELLNEKNFPVTILDHKKSTAQLAQDMYKYLKEEIKIDNSPSKDVGESASLKIKKEIENYVRN